MTQITNTTPSTPQPNAKGSNAPLVHLIGFGSQGRAWAENLRDSGWTVKIYLKDSTSPSWAAALEKNFEPQTLKTLGETLAPSPADSHNPALIAFLCPDHLIGGLYRQYLGFLEQPLMLVLAHGYSVYSGDLKALKGQHSIELLAPKAIGPQLRKAFLEARNRGTSHHDLAAATTSKNSHPSLEGLANGIGFDSTNLIQTTPDTEALADLLSEQGLLCGGLFTLLDWTIEAMEQAKIPGALTREECITELLLIAGLIKERGLETTLKSISQAALAGAATMNKALEASGAKAVFQNQLARVQSKQFVDDFNSKVWQIQATEMTKRFRNHDHSLEKKGQ